MNAVRKQFTTTLKPAAERASARVRYGDDIAELVEQQESSPDYDEAKAFARSHGFYEEDY